jgi:SET and MYND domain-containing protein 4
MKKSDEESNLHKNSGNEQYKKKLYQESLVSYNRALCFAKSDITKGLLYGNRSAVYFEVKRYQECIENIQMAKKFIGKEKITKLIERQEKCREIMKSQQQKHENPAVDFFKLSYKCNEKIPFIIEGIEPKTSDKYGHYLITTKDLKTGDIIAIEEPFIKYVKGGFEQERCVNCVRHNFFNLMPCDECCNGE